MGNLTTLKERLQFAIDRKKIKQKELAEKAAVSEGSISHWLTGARKGISGDNAQRVAKVLNISVDWLITGKGSIERSNIIALDDGDELPEGFVQIPEYRVSFGAGEGCEPTYEEIEDSVPATYRADFFRRLGVSPKNCKRFLVRGDSMEPLIRDGDYITVDCSPNQTVESNKIYAIIYGGNLRVKRLIKTLKELVIHSDNPIYPEEKLTADEANQLITIVGRVLDRSGTL